MEPFSPNRLTVARERRGLTKKALAEAVNLSAQAITDYETAASQPTPESANRLAFALHFPLGWFYNSSLEDLPQEAVSFRSQARMTARIRAKTLATGQMAYETLSPTFHKHFKFPALDIPFLDAEEPEKSAQLLRDHWKLGQGPITNMVHLLEAKGVEVYWLEADSECVDAVSFWRDNKPFVLLNTTKPAGERERFDLAHELAHLVLHRQAKIGDSRTLEKQAQSFASAFLLPEAQYRSECPRQPIMAQFLPLKKRWGVSIQAQVTRATELNIYTHWQYQTAFKTISMNGWRKQEPQPLPRQESALHKLAFEKLAQKGLTAIDIANQIQIGVEDLFEIAPVSQQFAQRIAISSDIQAVQSEHNHLKLVKFG